MPGAKVAGCAVYQRCPAAPALAPLGAYVYQAANTVPEFGLTSTVNPWPDVAAAYQFPDKAKSAFVGCEVAVEQVTFCVRRVSAMVPARPVPSVKLYDRSPLLQVSKLNVAVPTACELVIGGALKLPPTF